MIKWISIKERLPEYSCFIRKRLCLTYREDDFGGQYYDIYKISQDGKQWDGYNVNRSVPIDAMEWWIPINPPENKNA